MRLEHLLSGEAALSLPFEDRDEVVPEDRVEKSSVAFLLCLFLLSVFPIRERSPAAALS